MKFLDLIKKNLRYYLKSHHIPLALGTILCTAVLTGALIIGDSVKYSLNKITMDRLGQVTHSIESGDRYFRAKLADELEQDLNIPVAPVLQTDGILITQGGNQRLYNVHIIGVDDRFFKLSPAKGATRSPNNDQVLINDRISKKLGLTPDSKLTLRINEINFFPVDAPFAQDVQNLKALHATVAGVINNNDFGRFSLQNNQIAPYNVFVSLSTLSKLLNIPGRANTLLFANNLRNPLPDNELKRSLKFFYKLNDADYQFVNGSDFIELRSSRIFIDPVVSNAVNSAAIEHEKYFVYFVNQFKSGQYSTPYSFVSSRSSLPETDIIVNEWLANDLRIKKGDFVTLTFYVMGRNRSLVPDSVSLKIAAISSMQNAVRDRSLMPDYPGIAESDNCRDWDPGIPIDLDKIRDKDEKYWDDFGGTPKAWVSLATAQKLWGNRFGDITTIRFSRKDYSAELIENKILDVITPQELNMDIIPVKKLGLEASSQGVDFGQLFIGLSFFVILSALILTSLLFVLGLQRRAGESAIYMTLGYKPSFIKLVYFTELFTIAIPGVVIGVVLGIVYNQAILLLMASIWKGIVGTSDLVIKISLSTLLTGGFASLILISVSIFIVLKIQSLQTITTLQRQKGTIPFKKYKSTLWIIIISVLSLSILILLFSTDPGRGKQAYMPFFAGGSLFLALGMILFYVLLHHFTADRVNPLQSIKSLAISNITRNIRRSMSVVLLLAIGIFLVMAVGANRHGTLAGADKVSSGTGGFEYWLQTTIPVLKDLNSSDGINFLGIDDIPQDSISIFPIRYLPKDDASCLNLNRVKQPGILGINPTYLDSTGAFTFIQLDSSANKQHPWKSLELDYDTNVIPAIVDETVLVWGVGKALGDTLWYTNESGQELGLKIVGTLANSVFQGHVLITDQNFISQFPSTGGHSVFLFNSFPEFKNIIEQNVPRFTADYGGNLVSTVEKLAMFNQLENTYLTIFLVLGGLGLLLGSLGLGILVMRNILERQNEFALFAALGFSGKQIRDIVVHEHFYLLASGLVIGTSSSLFSMLPVLFTPGSQIPWTTILLIIALLLFFSWLWIHFFTHLVLKRPLLNALRTE